MHAYVRRWGAVYISACAFIFAALVYYISASCPTCQDRIYNADLFYLPDLISSLARGDSLANWHLSNTLYLFPDSLLLAITLALSHNTVLGLILGGLLQLLAAVGGFTWLGAALGGPRCAALGLLGAAAYMLTLSHLGEQYLLLIFNGFHAGIIAVLPYTLLLGLRMIDGPGSASAAGLLGLLVLLTSASDPLFVPQVGLPLALAVGLAIVRGAVERRCGAALLVALASGAALGLLLKRLLLTSDTRLMRYSSRAALDVILVELPRVLGLWLGSAVLVFSTVALALLARWAWRPASLGGRQAVALLTLTLGVPITLIAMLAEGVTLPRYILNLLLLPTFLGWPVLAAALPRARAKAPALTGRAIGLAGLAICLVSAPQLRSAGALAAYAGYYPSLAACLDQHADAYGLRRGLAQYWQARMINLFSRRGLRVAQVSPALQPYFWTNSLADYAQPFDFIVVEPAPNGDAFGLLAEPVLQRFGPPSASFGCGRRRVLVYHGQDQAALGLYNQLSMLAIAPRVAREVTIPGSALSGRLGRTSGPARASEPGQRGYLVLSAPADLASGSYEVELHYSAAGEGALGAIDLVARNELGRELELGEGLPIIAAPGRCVRLRFRLAEPGGFQIQLYVSGRGSVILDRIRLIYLGQA